MSFEMMIGEEKVKSLDPSRWICRRSGWEAIPNVFSAVELANGTKGKMFWLFCTCVYYLAGALRAGPSKVESREVCRVCEPR